MFNALNRFISRLDGDSQPNKETRGYGFQVLRNTNLELAIEPWFDYVVGINGRMIDNPDPRLFAQEVRNCAGSNVMLGLWSAKGQRTRALHIPVPADTGSLGLSLQWTPFSVASNVWHVLDVPANSPADTAGLLPYSDYILSSPDGVLHGESGLGELVDDYIGRPLKLWVYNNEYNVTREVTIHPSRDWGGEGAMGCVLGYGALHRLPAPLSEPVSAPGETMFDGDYNDAAGGDHFTSAPPTADAAASSSTFTPAAATSTGAPATEFLVPAQMVGTAPPPPSAGAPPRGKKKERHGHSPNRLDDYFAEEEKKSRELDGTSSTKPKAAAVAPPPPKAGAGAGPPPRATPKPEDQKEKLAVDDDVD